MSKYNIRNKNTSKYESHYAILANHMYKLAFYVFLSSFLIIISWCQIFLDGAMIPQLFDNSSTTQHLIPKYPSCVRKYVPLFNFKYGYINCVMLVFL